MIILTAMQDMKRNGFYSVMKEVTGELLVNFELRLGRYSVVELDFELRPGDFGYVVHNKILAMAIAKLCEEMTGEKFTVLSLPEPKTFPRAVE